MQHTLNLKAGATARQVSAGSYFLILDDGGAGAVMDVKFRDHAQVLEEIRTAKRGTKARLHKGQFTSVELTSDRDCTLEIIISDGAVDVDYFNGANVNATIAGPHTGTVADPINVAGVTINDAPASAINDKAQVACSAVVAVVKAANANSRRARFTNFGPNAVALGGAGITWATRTIVLNVGDTWVEDNAANLAWSGVTDAGNTATVGVQEIVQ